MVSFYWISDVNVAVEMLTTLSNTREKHKKTLASETSRTNISNPKHDGANRVMPLDSAYHNYNDRHMFWHIWQNYNDREMFGDF